MAVRFLLALLTAALLGACDAPVREFATLADAREAGVFRDGWLPDLLPPSAALIQVRADTRDRTASGQFHFSSVEYAALVQPLKPVTPPTGEAATDAFITRNELRGYAPFEHRSDQRAWLFMCAENKGRCYFRSWPAG
jgi:hypothetical protein